jgi:excisionase family DNA binding protein
MDSHKKLSGPLITVAQAADIFCVCEKTIRNWLKNGHLSAQRIGTVIRIRRSDVEKLIGGAE